MNSLHYIANMELEIRDIIPMEWQLPKNLVKLHEESKCPFPWPYKTQRGLKFTIGRKPGKNRYDGYNCIYFCNMVRRFVNARNEYLIMTFDLSHENTHGFQSVQEIGKTCLPQEIRFALNGVLCRQVKGNEYELHAVNSSPVEIDITTSHISKKGSSSHDDFAPNIKLGTIMPGSELHIPWIYMKAGYLYSDEIDTFVSGQLIKPSDSSNFMHNGLTGFLCNNLIDEKTDTLKENPLLVSSTSTTFTIPLQPYVIPEDILRNTFDQIKNDFNFIKSSISHLSSKAGETNINYISERMSLDIKGDELTLISKGKDESIFRVIVGNAKMLDSIKCTHYTVSDLIRDKAIRLRLCAPNVFNLFLKSLNIAIDQVDEIIQKVATI